MLRDAQQPLRVGLVWAGNPKHQRDRLRSIPFALAGTAARTARRLRSCRCRRTRLRRRAAAAIRWQRLKDFLDTARIVAELDLVITVDTSVAHLAGAMGKPVWILIASSPDWRWGLGTETTPWYPTMRLFRQPLGEGWESTIARVAAELCGSLVCCDRRRAEGSVLSPWRSKLTTSHAMPTRLIPALKGLLHLLCLAAVRLSAGALSQRNAGARSRSGEPHHPLHRRLGAVAAAGGSRDYAAAAVHTALGFLIRFRRMVGLYAFFYATLHLATYVFLFSGYDIPTAVAGLKAGHVGEVWRSSSWCGRRCGTMSASGASSRWGLRRG